MIQEQMIEDIVRQVLQDVTVQKGTEKGKNQAEEVKMVEIQDTPAPKSNKNNLDYKKDYPLASQRPELVQTPTGKTLKDIKLESVLNDKLKAEDLRISESTLELQAQIAESVGRQQLANNLRRASELIAIPDDRILEIYNAMRPYRSTKEELLDIADELEQKYSAQINANFIREAAEVYERRNRLRTD